MSDTEEEALSSRGEENTEAESQTPHTEDGQKADESLTPLVGENTEDQSLTPRVGQNTEAESLTPRNEENTETESQTPHTEDGQKADEILTPLVGENTEAESQTTHTEDEQKGDESLTPRVEQNPEAESSTPRGEENTEAESLTPRGEENTEAQSLTPRDEENTEAESLTPRDEENTEAESQTPQTGDEQKADESLTPQVGESLKYALECPVCLEYMQPPIMMCKSGHNVCRECRPYMNICPTCRQPLTTTRNVALENLARELFKMFPAKEPVVPQPTPSVELEPSEYELAHGCPLECSWIGKRADMRVHMLSQHKDKFLDGVEHNNCKWKLPLIVRDVRVIFAFGEVFRYRLRLHTLQKTFYIAVQYIGPATEASKFRYEVEVSSDQKVILMGNPTLEEQVDIYAVFESGGCVMLDYDLVKSVGQGKQLSYYIKLSRAVPDRTH